MDAIFMKSRGRSGSWRAFQTPKATLWPVYMGAPVRLILRLGLSLCLPLLPHHLVPLGSVSAASDLVSATSIPGKPRTSKTAGP